MQEVLASERQALWSALRLSISNRFGYFQQHVHPSLCEPVSARLDAALWQILEAAAGFKIPRGREPGGLPLEIPAVPFLHGKSFQEVVVRLPARLHGWGLRSLESNCGSAYLGTLETSIPFMAGLGKVCPQLEEVRCASTRG